jgi:hypothetical protein
MEEIRTQKNKKKNSAKDLTVFEEDMSHVEVLICATSNFAASPVPGATRHIKPTTRKFTKTETFTGGT